MFRLLIIGWLAFGSIDTVAIDLTQFLTALRSVESSGRSRPRDGDGGRSIGPFQIGRRYWEDASAQRPELRHAGYQACRRSDYAVQIVLAYFERYGGDALVRSDWQRLARLHNGGPDGDRQVGTVGFWRKVQVRLR